MPNKGNAVSPSPQQTHPTLFHLWIRFPAFIFQGVHIHAARAGFASESAVPAKPGVSGFEEFFAPEVVDAEAVFAGAVQNGEEDFVLVVAVGAEGIGDVHEHGVAHADVEHGGVGAATFVLQDQADAVGAVIGAVGMGGVHAGDIWLRLAVAEMPDAGGAAETHVGEAGRGLDIVQAFGRLRKDAEGRAEVAVGGDGDGRIAHAAAEQVAHCRAVADARRRLQPPGVRRRKRMPGDTERFVQGDAKFGEARLSVAGVAAYLAGKIEALKHMQGQAGAVGVGAAVAHPEANHRAAVWALVGLHRRSGRASIPGIAVREAVAAAGAGCEQGRFIGAEAVAVGADAGAQGVQHFHF